MYTYWSQYGLEVLGLDVVHGADSMRFDQDDFEEWMAVVHIESLHPDRLGIECLAQRTIEPRDLGVSAPGHVDDALQNIDTSVRTE